MNAREPVVMRNGDERSGAFVDVHSAGFQTDEEGFDAAYDGGIYDNFPWRPRRGIPPDLIVGSICTGKRPAERNSSIPIRVSCWRCTTPTTTCPRAA
ncbi:MAG: hypothetical protein ACLRMJ_06110 [Alistipes finegoldii]